ncbi:enoyl-CoA hydratase/isomerase family protein [Nocardioides sp. GY 10113]|uniref:enoyl-CoA hydratase/isomerase family protein n=1 Tax=Nocardioides sp. GY 10113 TaxID=2569761 RepID=UPI0010A84EE8|nr:enoyl-CoA hydratase/isomerase family protein [Nocardioides sp. GY 10113]TIC85055.1 enoyl-CoA hydratase/isomerase family protein [Nocardioides sp. GY 10113]
MTAEAVNGGGAETTQPPVLVRRAGHAGYLELNRPKAINALTLEMVDIISAALEEWVTDDEVKVVVLTGAGERGLCAGGDIVALWHDAKAGGTDAAEFWAAEYRLNDAIKHYPKPYVAVMDGIVLGGGIGLSAHGAFRIVTERSSIGMPETGIGFLPDVGGTWLLSRAPGETGTHLALTAGSVRAGDAIAIGMADHYMESAQIPALLDLLATKDVEHAIGALAEGEPPSSDLLAARSWIDEAYAGDDVAAILDRLRARPEPEAQKAADRIAGKSPTSLAITLRALREATSYADLADALEVEYRLALRCHGHHDFVEGIRAQVVDKDRDPRWSPASIAEVTTAEVDAFFAPLGADEPAELGLPGTPPPTSTTTTTPGKEQH